MQNVVGERLAAARKKKNYTQEEIARYLNCGRATITNYENGRRSPDLETLINLARKYEVSTDYLLGLSKNFTPDNELQFIGNYTGLSDEAIKVLHEATMINRDELNDLKIEHSDIHLGNDISKIISYLLDEGFTDFSKLICLDDISLRDYLLMIDFHYNSFTNLIHKMYGIKKADILTLRKRDFIKMEKENPSANDELQQLREFTNKISDTIEKCELAEYKQVKCAIALMHNLTNSLPNSQFNGTKDYQAFLDELKEFTNSFNRFINYAQIGRTIESCKQEGEPENVK